MEGTRRRGRVVALALIAACWGGGEEEGTVSLG